MNKYLVALIFLMASCGGTGPSPETGSNCSSNPDLMESCLTCSSEMACAWWGTEDTQFKGCHADIDTQVPEGVTVVNISDLCNNLPLEQAR